MGLAKRIIPVILHKNGQLVKGQKFVNDRVIGHALQSARIHAIRGVDELMILDVSATQEGREPNYDLVRSLAETNFSPLTVGGGIKTAEHVKQLLRAGADKVCIGEAKSPELLKELTDKFGSSTITVSLDFEKYDGSHMHKTIIRSVSKVIEDIGAGEIIVQYVDKDGTLEGYEIDLIKQVTKTVSIPVIASSGCSGYEDMYQALRAGADAVAAGALFQFTDATPAGAAEYLGSKGMEVRKGISGL